MWTKPRSTASSFFVALALSGAFSTMARGQAGATPGPGTALPPPSEQRLRMPLLMPDDFSLLHLVAWRVEYATPDPENPLLEGDMPWDAGGVGIHGSVFKGPSERKMAGLSCLYPTRRIHGGLAAALEVHERPQETAMCV